MRAKSWFAYVLVPVLVLLAAALRARGHVAREAAPLVASSFAAAPEPARHDPRKPTAAIVLGADVTEITDMVVPYEMLARAGRFNVYAVAPSSASTTLTGGLRVRPHHSFASLDRVLGGAAPAVVVVPNVPNVDSPANRAVVEWVRRSAGAGAVTVSWCAGAAVLAEAGLLDGRTATSHWGDLARLERQYPRVAWQRGVRWIDHGSILTSAGITSGIDATLRLLTRLYGEDAARRVSAELRYPNFHFAVEPRAEQYEPRLADAVLFLNAAFAPSRQQIGVVLYEGIGELDVSTIYDAHAAAGIAEVHAVGARAGLVRTAHGLWLEPALVPEHDASAIAALDRVMVAGRYGRTQAASVVGALGDLGAIAPEYPHADGPERFSLEPVLEDLARSADVTSATFAQRRLEYRSSSLRLKGRAVPVALLSALLLGAAAVLASLALARRLRGGSRASRPAASAVGGTPPAG